MAATTATSSNASRILCIWDFDQSFIDVNSDTWVFTTPAEGERDSDKGEKAKAKGRDPEAAAYIRANHRSTQWTQLMDDVLVKAQNEGTTTVKDLQEILPKMPSSASVAAKHLDEKEATQYIVSDANEFYISVFLEGTGLNTIIEGFATNEGRVRDGILRVSPYQGKETPHGCERCPVNLCKCLALRRLLSSSKTSAATPQFETVFFVGDGGNDYCIARTLLMLGACAEKEQEEKEERDEREKISTTPKLATVLGDCVKTTTVFARRGYSLAKKLAKEMGRKKGGGASVEARTLAGEDAKRAFAEGRIAVVEWDDGDELLRRMKDRLKDVK